MFFTIANPNKHDLNLYGNRTLSVARRIIFCYPMKAEELKLNEYLRAKIGMGLKAACLEILKHCKYAAAKPTELTILIKDPKLDQLARLITYGNEELFGSNILKEAFKIKPI